MQIQAIAPIPPTDQHFELTTQAGGKTGLKTGLGVGFSTT